MRYLCLIYMDEDELAAMPEPQMSALNERPVHCDQDGRLDYLADGSMAPDPIRPNDWH